MSDPKKPRGRPVEHKLPEPIPDIPENIMKAFLKMPPRKRKDWKFVQERDKKHKGLRSHTTTIPTKRS